MIDTREVLDPSWAALERAHTLLLWDAHYAAYAGVGAREAQTALRAWEERNARAWNASKPWYAPRLPVPVRECGEGGEE